MNRKTFKLVGIDLDKAEGQTDASFDVFLAGARKRAKSIGIIITERHTRRGHHIKILLPRRVSFWRTIDIRYYVGDDPRRMFYDIMRWRTGGTMVDTLYDVKQERVPMNGLRV